MPSRSAVALILLFWLVTSAYVIYAEMIPRYFSDGAPPLRIDLADEAAQTVAVRWIVYRGDQRVGALTTRMEYANEDDSFRFINSYSELKFDFAVQKLTLSMVVPTLETVMRVSRQGDLKEQQMTGRLEARLGGVKLGEAKAQVNATVVDGQLTGRCVLQSPLLEVDEPLEPVPAPSGQVLNPMMPVSRLRDVQPGRRWVIHEVNPLFAAINAMMKDQAKKSELLRGLIPDASANELVAEVGSKPVILERAGFEPVKCWLIEYRGEKGNARTWVSVSDGRVLCQEANAAGEVMRFIRQD